MLTGLFVNKYIKNMVLVARIHKVVKIWGPVSLLVPTSSVCVQIPPSLPLFSPV